MSTAFGTVALPAKFYTRPTLPANLKKCPNPLRLPADSMLQIVLVAFACPSSSPRELKHQKNVI